jgi:hemolysin III
LHLAAGKGDTAVVKSLERLQKRPQSLGEEVANSVSHGMGLTALAAAPFLMMHAGRRQDAGFIAGACIFAVTMVLLYLASTLYHALPAGKAKRVLRAIEHCAIFMLIAGTYSPFMLGVLRGAWGWTLFGLIWGLALVGVVLKTLDRLSHPIASTGLYLLMGWLLLIAVKPFYARVPVPGLLWLVAGGLAYTAGVFFFAIDSRVRYAHFAWHVFVLTGTACHYFAVLWYGS